MSSLKVSDYIAKFLRDKDVDLVFTITGAGNIRMIESINRYGIKYICTHHEQAAVMAAIARFRVSGKPAICLFTGGPGAANTLTGVADAFLDSIPCIVIAGQEKVEFINNSNALRGKGVQGLKMVQIMSSVTKYSTFLHNPIEIREVLEKGFEMAYEGRPGPVWIEIPQDLQWAEVNPSNMQGFSKVQQPGVESEKFSDAVLKTIELLNSAKKPLIWVGNGVRLAKSEENFLKLIELLQVPVLVSWQGADILEDSHPLYVGRAGIYGQRWANFALQSCDLLLCLGTRLAIPQRGYVDKEFAPNAKKIIVDIDPAEIEKFTFPVEVPVVGNVKEFIEILLNRVSRIEIKSQNAIKYKDWMEKCRDWRKRFPMSNPPDLTNINIELGVNSYWFIERLSHHLEENDIIVTDMGTSLTCTHATIRLKKGQRLVTSTGLGEMGFGLPAAIGASLADRSRRVILITGEGSLMMNLQELQTLKHHNLPIKIFILNNNGYLTIKHTHNSLFDSLGTAEATSPQTGLSFPNFAKLSAAFDIMFSRVDSPLDLDSFIDKSLQFKESIISEVLMPEFQELIPKSSLKRREDGSIYSPPLEDLYPFLTAEALAKEMDYLANHKEF